MTLLYAYPKFTKSIKPHTIISNRSYRLLLTDSVLFNSVEVIFINFAIVACQLLRKGGSHNVFSGNGGGISRSQQGLKGGTTGN